jgi:DNA adenine methylase
MCSAQAPLFPETPLGMPLRSRPRGQILKWVGNKYRYASVIAEYLPAEFDTYYEPFVGTGAVLATMRPSRAIAADTLPMLVALLQTVQTDSDSVADHYETWRDQIAERGRDAYLEVRDRYNQSPNPLDLMVLSRTCYGGVVRFTREGTMSTPMGPHRPMPAEKLRLRLDEWRERIASVRFKCQDFSETIGEASDGDLVYCDPPYAHGQTILYGAQDFRLERLWEAVAHAVERGAAVAVSVDGWRQSGDKEIDLGLADGLFARELLIERGGCMLRRFQMTGEDMASEQVADRLLLSW